MFVCFNSEYLCFYVLTPAHHHPAWMFSFHFSYCFSLKWLGISIRSSIVSIRNKLVDDSRKKIQAGYLKIEANRGKFNRKALRKLHLTFCDHENSEPDSTDSEPGELNQELSPG